MSRCPDCEHIWVGTLREPCRTVVGQRCPEHQPSPPPTPGSRVGIVGRDGWDGSLWVGRRGVVLGGDAPAGWTWVQLLDLGPGPKGPQMFHDDCLAEAF